MPKYRNLFYRPYLTEFNSYFLKVVLKAVSKSVQELLGEQL
jgi:hypothetical protein